MFIQYMIANRVWLGNVRRNEIGWIRVRLLDPRARSCLDFPESAPFNRLSGRGRFPIDVLLKEDCSET
jgi:hypothetical protein